MPPADKKDDIITRLSYYEKLLLKENYTNKEYNQYLTELDVIYDEAGNVAPKSALKIILDENLYTY